MPVPPKKLSFLSLPLEIQCLIADALLLQLYHSDGPCAEAKFLPYVRLLTTCSQFRNLLESRLIKFLLRTDFNKPSCAGLPILVTIEKRNVEGLKHYLDMYPELLELDDGHASGRDIVGHTPLAGACGMARVEMVKILLEKGAKVECRDSNLRTPLHCVASHYGECRHIFDCRQAFPPLTIAEMVRTDPYRKSDKRV